MKVPSAKRGDTLARQLKPGMEALGVVMSFLCREQPFADFRAGRILTAVQHQLSSGCHVCLLRDERLVAYAGWLPIRTSDGERWMRGETDLKPVQTTQADAVALTILSVASPALIAPLLRACRPLAPQRIIYFKRDYGGGRVRKTRMLVSG